MKNLLLLPVVLIACFSMQAQANLETYDDLALFEEIETTPYRIKDIGDKGFKFESVATGINTEYSDYGIGFFKGKFISYSARKIGAIAKKDPITNEPFTRLYCSDIIGDWDLDRPLLFSYILNKNENVGSLSFTQDGNTLFYTKSKKGNTQSFQMFKTVMDPDRPGKWINIEPVSFNDERYSFENPHLSPDGKTLFFSSNKPGGKGGFDIYQTLVLEDGSFGPVASVDGTINTAEDEKFPHTSIDGKFLFFSSKGHENAGGYDIFKSRRTKQGYVTILNLGNTINTEKDEIAFIPATDRIGYITSNRDGGNGRYDIYKITEYVISQDVKGRVVDFETGIPLSDVRVRLIDTDGTEVESAITNEMGAYDFPISSFEYYTVVANKEGYFPGSSIFNTDNVTSSYDTDVTIKTVPAEIVKTAEKSYIKISNIQFDYNSAAIRPISTITMNTVYQTLTANPEVKVALNAHSDTQGSSAYNQKLSQLRAQSAVDYLVAKGIDSARLIATGYGESQPLVNCSDCSEVEHETNRRIEFIIIED